MKLIRAFALLSLSIFALRCEAAASWFAVSEINFGYEQGLSVYYYGFATPEVASRPPTTGTATSKL